MIENDKMIDRRGILQYKKRLCQFYRKVDYPKKKNRFFEEKPVWRKNPILSKNPGFSSDQPNQVFEEKPEKLDMRTAGFLGIQLAIVSGLGAMIHSAGQPWGGLGN